MEIFRCKMCGGDLEITEGQAVCTCEFCGTEQTLPRLDSNRKANLYDRANHFRRNNDFDKAMGIYEQILNEDNTDSEAYWSLVLCRYGIEYVEDVANHKRIPTINRAQYTSIYADENYKAAIEYATIAQKMVYEQEAKTIDAIQRGILAISEKEEPFDVFICYKETDDTGKRTQDSVLANDLYYQLVQEGFKVFFARITLEDKLGQEYEPYIFAALNSAKVMVVLGTKPDYFKAVWVKNEWARYLSLIRSGAKKMLIPAYKDMDPYDLPEEFSHLQALDMAKLGFVQDLIRGIKKIIGKEHSQTGAQETVVVQQSGGSGNVNALIKRGNMALEDGEWEKADEFFEEVLNQNAECAEAYIGKLMVKCMQSDIASLTHYYSIMYEFPDNEELEACEEEKERIESAVSQYKVQDFLSDIEIRKLYEFDRHYISELSSRRQQKEQVLLELTNEKHFARAKKYASGKTLDSINQMLAEVTSEFDGRIEKAQKEDEESIASIKSAYVMQLDNADIKARELYTKALESQEATYNARVAQMNEAKSWADFENVRDLFQKMNGYKDSIALAEKCQKEIDRLKEEERLENERRCKEVKRKKIRKKLFTLSVQFVIIGIIVLILVNNMILIPNKKYNAAIDLMSSGDILEAYMAFDALNGYKDSQKKMELIIKENPMKALFVAEKGDIVEFGNYNGNTQWIVLAKENDRILLISKYAIEMRSFNTEYKTITWEESTLRSWLNSTYIDSAFNSDEQKIIANVSIRSVDNLIYGTDGGNGTTDQVFLLSTNEVNEYFSSDNQRKLTLLDGTSVWWWLRSPGIKGSYIACVGKDGSVRNSGVDVNYGGAVRPAMWIDISEL